MNLVSRRPTLMAAAGVQTESTPWLNRRALVHEAGDPGSRTRSAQFCIKHLLLESESTLVSHRDTNALCKPCSSSSKYISIAVRFECTFTLQDAV